MIDIRTSQLAHSKIFAFSPPLHFSLQSNEEVKYGLIYHVNPRSRHMKSIHETILDLVQLSC